MIGDVKKHLNECILPFWKNLKDEENGGYYGEVDFNLNTNMYADKGVILHSRILWFFSNSYLTLRNKDDLEYATHAFNFLVEHCFDKEYGGVYWSVTCKGTPVDTTKHTYNQAFAIYALSSYYDASKNPEALRLARELYDLIETKCRDKVGYLEAFKRDFEPESNEKLSENGVVAYRTMNTLLHVFEAYTELYRVDKSLYVRDSLVEMLNTVSDKVYNPEKRRQEVFFDRDMNSLIDLHSYGHDIEAAWLIDRGLEILDEEEITNKISVMTREMTECVYEKAYTPEGLIYEDDRGNIDRERVWWVQNEAVVGFINGYQKDNTKTKYLDAVKVIWEYSLEHLVDKRPGSEWFWGVDEEYNPWKEKGIAGPWKCPYHNGRMCFEVIRRNIDV